MNTRKFYLIISTVISIFLFVSGSFLLHSISAEKNSAPESDGDNGSILSDILEPFQLEKDPINVLVMGGDIVAGNTDTMMLVNYNPSTGKINLLSLPRDTQVYVKGSSVPKINSAYPVGGAKLAVDTVSKLLNVKIKYNVFINTEVFSQIIDMLGGVDYNVPVDMNYEDPEQDLYIHLKKGNIHMDGAQALQFMRFRQPSYYSEEIWQYYDGGDLKRIDAQQNFIKELIKQKANIRYLPMLKDIINETFNNVDTNVYLADALKLSQGLSKVSADGLNMMKLPGEAVEEETGSYYVYDKQETEKLVKQYFTVKSGSVGSTAKDNSTEDLSTAPKSYSKPTGSYNDGNTQDSRNTSGNSSVPSEDDTTNKSVTEGNPSNDRSSYTDVNRDIP